MGRRWAPPPAEPNCWDAGPLHVQEQRARAAPGVELTLALLGGFAGLVRSPCSGPRRAAHAGASPRFPRRSRNSCRSSPARAGRGASLTLLRVSDFIWTRANSRSSWMSASGALDRVEHFVQLAAPGALFTHAAHLSLNFSLQLATTIVEHLSSGRNSGTRSSPAPLPFLSVLHDRRSFRPAITRSANA